MDATTDMTNTELLDALTEYSDQHTATVADRAAQSVADTLSSRMEIDNVALLDAVRSQSAESGDTDGVSDAPQSVALAPDQWEVVDASLRLQNTCGVLGLVLLGVLVGCVLWSHFAPRRDF